MKARLLLASLLLLSCLSTAQLNANYNIVVEENGNALVVLVVKGVGNINVPLPLDVKSPAVKGALYVQSENGVEISIDADGSATIVYKTALLTNKEVDKWFFMMDLPEFDTASVVLSLPVNTRITSTNPNAAISAVDDNKNIIWNLKPHEEPRVFTQFSYTESTLADLYNPKPGTIALRSVILTLIIILTFVALYVWNRSRSGKIYSSGKQNVLKTLSGNETKIVSMLLHNDGGMQRNRLERESGIAKSSLASSLQNLEKKNIITVDRNYSTHFVELTEWFKQL